jgi:hypothetical protein
VPPRLVYFLDAFRMAAFGTGVDTADVATSTAAGVLMGICIELGDAELGTGYPAVGGDGFACTAKPLLVPLMINATATASTIAAPRSTARRTQ